MNLGGLSMRLRIREKRTACKMSIRELAEYSGIDTSSLYRIEKHPDKLDLRISTLCLLADALDCSLDDLVEIRTK